MRIVASFYCGKFKEHLVICIRILSITINEYILEYKQCFVHIFYLLRDVRCLFVYYACISFKTSKLQSIAKTTL